MSDVPRYYLDRRGDAHPKLGCVLIETETEFLQHVRSEQPLHLRGPLLCDWATQVAQARDWKVEFLSSPATTLLNAIPGLTLAQAQAMLDRLGSRFDTLALPISVTDLLQIFAPADLWNAMPTGEHAAQWLLWLDVTEPSDFLVPLLTVQAQQWSHECAEVLQPIYAVTNPLAAQRLLRVWLHIETGKMDTADPFPLPVPIHWIREAHEAWRQAMVRTEGGFYAELTRIALPSDLQTAAAQVAYSYFHANIAHLERLDSASQARLRSLLTRAETAELTRLRPPATPSPLPTELADVLRWFTREYLPYRQWQAEHGDPAAGAWVAQIAREYAAWLLRIYPVALHSADNANYNALSVASARRLRENREDGVTFWIILDGMIYSDAEVLLSKIETESRLTRALLRPVLSPLPTITRFCKPALMNGTTQTSLAGDTDPIPTFEGAELLRRDSDPAAALQYATNGKIYVWSLVEPDASYHQLGADRATILRNVQSELEKAAYAIKAAALAVPDNLRLRIVLSTDHGRLLTPASRLHSVPPDMESHGRTAYGMSHQTPTRDGYHIVEDTVTLFGSRFDLPCDVTVPLDGNAFRKNNDATGTEQFCHGGLYPEETIVPWAEILRDRKTPTIRVMVRGKAKAGTRGTLEITLENSSSIPVVLRTLTLYPGSQMPVVIPFEKELRGLTKREETADIERWFRAADAERSVAIAIFDLTNGSSFEIEAEVTLSSIEMYQRENLLEDL
jgi:hypothetical protein